MLLGKKKKKFSNISVVSEEKEEGLDLVAFTTGIGKKQVHTGERLGQRRQRPRGGGGVLWGRSLQSCPVKPN